MVIDIANARIDFAAAGNAEILRNVHMILTTPEGTVPFDREFGVPVDLVDLPMEEAKRRLTMAYIQKVKRYEPRAKVQQVTFEASAEGKIIPKVVIGLVN